MKKLELTFKSENGKNKNLGFNYIEGDLTADKVMPAMQRLSDLNLFRDKDGNLYKEPVAAKIIDTNNQVLFDKRIKNTK
ncbi:DUF2922 domain-containing protein [Lactobacillus kunkeei]|uniref:DUF2922 domain-containing protein n=1 Tax=Apilactobacillus nanyangensis TaxID=2799579 RepID=A0ABT0HXI3_9LACO|nr:DUF2922 domain-containing protein [Apilactobacillus nanyangensis]MBC6388635.1 DUF2922 domain-containing protein [Apilactobacillus kunkeei]MCK8611429.1 DUF2922 domain-containing protein [Apilactobacillus nanyangensis]TMT00555.1 DUF2922 domain-containing protein [Apilactobacillus kunkeei]TMT03512.1 DUF2922 domain-containing protein [Apilactobacillus kunkeei]CAI2627778.1 hypothetical protein AKUA1404_02540 [Apilactobacillus kunkeei]